MQMLLSWGLQDSFAVGNLFGVMLHCGGNQGNDILVYAI